MKIMITGGTGLIGSALATSLIKDRHDVIVLTRNPSRRTHLPPQVRLVGWDGSSVQGWGEFVEGADAIVNLAGESIAGNSLLSLVTRRWTPEYKKQLLDSRIKAGDAITQAISKAHDKPRVLIQASAVGYYGNRGDEELDEDSTPANDFLADICIKWEASTAGVESLGVRRAIIRTAGVTMSTSGGSFPYIMLPFRFFAGGPIGNGRQWFSWIHIADEINAIRFLIDSSNAAGVFNLVAPQTIRNGAFSKILGRVMGRPAWLPTPAIFFKLAFGEKAGILLSSQKQIPRRLLSLGYAFQFPQLEPALRELLGK